MTDEPADSRETSPTETELSDRMSFLEHLDELRVRLIRCLLAVAVAFILCFSFNIPIFRMLAAPIKQVLPAGQKELFYTTPTEGFGISMKVSLLAGIFVASPF